MPPSPGNAPLDETDAYWISQLAELYDKFANSLDPHSDGRHRAELVFMQQVALWYDLRQNHRNTNSENSSSLCASDT